MDRLRRLLFGALLAFAPLIAQAQPQALPRLVSHNGKHALIVDGAPFLMLGAPQIAETLRLVLGWAWTYVIVAELIGASNGIGHMITDSQALLATDQIIFGIITIGVIGLISDLAFKRANRAMFKWAAL